MYEVMMWNQKNGETKLVYGKTLEEVKVEKGWEVYEYQWID